MEIYTRSWDEASLAFNLTAGTYSIDMPPLKIQDASVAAEVHDIVVPEFRWRLGAETDSETRFSATTQDGVWDLVFRGENGTPAPGLVITLSLQPTSAVRHVTLMPLCVPGISADHLLVHGARAGGCEAHVLPSASATRFSSFFQTMISAKGTSLQVSHPLLQPHPSSLEGELCGRTIRNLTFKTPVPCRDRLQVLRSSPVTLRVSSRPHQLMTDWADRNVEHKKEFGPAKTGWNSWDYYRWTVTEEDILENARFIASDPVLSRHVQRIIIDDGWQYCYGEWEANPLFPSGMEVLARKIRQLGFEPGLWIAPTIIEPHCRIAQIETDMLAMGDSGLPCLAYQSMERRGFVLDPTRKKTRAWLRALFSRFADMGYTYFKLDFLWQTLKAPRFHDASVPRGGIMRKIMEPVHEAVGGRAEILGCNYLLEGGTALVDEVRISGDIHANWQAVKRNVHSVAARFWSHERLWRNDPDFALCRGPETSDDPDLHRLKPCLVAVPPRGNLPVDREILNSSLVDNGFEQAQVLLSIVIVSGGVINLSDKMTALNRRGIELARKTVAASPGQAGIPLDLFETRHPRRWIQKLHNGGVRLLLINWEDREEALGFDLREQGVPPTKGIDFWNGGPVDIHNGRLRAVLRPRSCLLAEFPGCSAQTHEKAAVTE